MGTLLGCACEGEAFSGAHSPWCLRCSPGVPLRCVFSLVSQMWAHCSPYPCGNVHSWLERRLELLLQENSPNCCQVSLSLSFFFPLFLFEKFLLLNPAAPYKEGPVLSHSPPLQLEQGLSRTDMAQLSTLSSRCTRSLWVYYFVLIPLPATSSNQVSLGAAQTLFGRGGSC